MTELDALLKTLGDEIETIEAFLADADAFARDPKQFEARSKRLESARGERDAAEAEWLDLEMLREELAAGA